MKIRLLLFIFAVLLTLPSQADLPVPFSPRQIAIVYNSDEPKSEELAFSYARKRDVPASNLIGLPLPKEGTISRKSYNETIRDPLIKRFETSDWWLRRKDQNGVLIPIKNNIRVLLLMRGVPYRIERLPYKTDGNGKEIKPEPLKRNEASVDSELCLLGIENTPLEGPLNNPIYEKSSSITDPSLAPLLLTCRIDGPNWEICERLIDDAMAIEQEGLWGTSYLDLAFKGENYETGDDWIRAIARRNYKEGIPTVIEQTRDTYLTNYPMTEASLYFGWYAGKANGPLLNKDFRFKRGAVAIHIHSFSAAKLHDTRRHWVGPILAKGAAATVGNTWEPYLDLTINLEIFHDRLLKGYTLAEAAHMAQPATSWQSVVIGDPLYRPFLIYNEPARAAATDKDYRAFRVASQQWSTAPDTLTTKLRTAAARMSSGRLYESLGLRLLQEGKSTEAEAFFNSAATEYLGQPDKLRQVLHRIALLRSRGEKQQALALLAEAKERFGDIPEAKSLVGLQNILYPPAPPPAKPKR